LGTDPGSPVKADGPVRALRAALRRARAYRWLRRLGGRLTAPFRVLRVHLLYRKDLTPPIHPFRARVPIRVVTADPGEIEEVARINRGATQDLAAIYRERIGNGALCFVALVDGTIIGYNWIATRSLVDVDGKVIRLGGGDVFCLDAFTSEPSRGNAIHTELLSRMLEWARAQGYRTAYTEVSAVLRRSWKTHHRLDWELTGKLLHLRSILGLRPRLWRMSGSAYPIAGVEPGHRGW